MLDPKQRWGLRFALLSAPMFADRDDAPGGIPHLDHVFVIMMENHGYQQVINNPNEPYLNSLIANKKVNLATNYFAVGHPSLTNYLEIVGGSNFGVRSDNPPDWHDTTCTPNIVTGIVNADNSRGTTCRAGPGRYGEICPIAGRGQDAETPAVDNWNEVTCRTFPFLADIDGVKSVPAAPTEGKTIGDQLVRGRIELEELPGKSADPRADLVNYSNGTASNLTDFTPRASDLGQRRAGVCCEAQSVCLFQKRPGGNRDGNSLENVVGFDGPSGLVCRPGQRRSSVLGIYRAEPMQ